MGLSDEREVDVAAAAPATIPFFHDFSCREKELQFLLAALRHVFSTGELSREEWDLLREFHDGDADAAARVRPLALVSGHSGIGKSRLLEEAKEVARGSGVHVKEVFCYERQGIPFLPVLRVVKELLAETNDPRHLWEPYAPVLTRVYPELAGDLGEAQFSPELPDDVGKVQLFHALTGILCAVSRERPLLLLFHDLHRSDEGTVEFLEYLARNVVLESVERGERNASQLTTTVNPDGEETGDAWKKIGQRAQTAFITDGLSSDSTATPGAPIARLMAVVNYLELPTANLDVADAKDAKDRDAKDRGSDAGGDSEPTSRSAVQARLNQLRRGPFARSLQLAPLDSEELGALVARTLRVPSIPAKVTARIHEVVQGNPLYALEICRCLFEEGALAPGADDASAARIDTAALNALIEEVTAVSATTPRETPTDIPSECLAHQLVTRRVASLDPVQQRLVKVLATLRRPAPTSRLVSLADGDEKGVSEALDALHGRDFVKVVSVGGMPFYFLAHEAYTRGVYRHLPAEEARELHERVGRTLAALPEASEPVRAYEIYEHLRQSAAPKDSSSYGMTAARYFERGFALQLAIKIETHLLSLLGSDEDLPHRQELLAELGRLHLRQGNPGVAKRFFKQLLEASANLDPQRHLEAYCELAESYRAAGEPHKGIKILNRAEKQCSEALDERAQGSLCALRARLRLDRQDAKRAIHLCMRGLQTVENVAEADPERIELLETLAEAHLARAETVAALPHFQRLLELVEGVGDEAKQAAVLSRVGRVYYDRGNYFRAARFLFKALDVIRRLGDVQGLSRAYDGLGKVYRNSGDNIRGLEYFNRSLRIRERTGDVEGLSPTLNSLGSLYAHNGDYFRAIRYFKRSIENSQRINNTAGLVRAFLHLGWVHYQIGEFRQVESLAKQILILSSEFNVDAELEGEGHRLRGNLYFGRGDWKRTERAYRKAIEIASKRSRKKGEAAALLDLGELQCEREEFEAALKQISRGQLLAEEIRSMPLRARANLLKGHVYRSLKGGNSERAKECYHKGVELLSTENPLPLMWELEYSLAKVHQESLEFAEARECYGRAEAILERIAGSLPEDMKIAYRDDRRRKVFFEDYRRFQKEAAGRTSTPAGTEVNEREEKVWALPRQALLAEDGSASAVERVCTALARITASTSCAMWGKQLVEEARRLVPSPSGALLVTDPAHPERLIALANRDLGAEQEWLAADRCPGVFFTEVVRTGKAMVSGGEEWSDRLAAVDRGNGYRNRSMVIVPLASGGRPFGALYLQRPSAANPFLPEEQALLQRLVDTVVGQYDSLQRLQRIVTHNSGPLLSAAGLRDALHEAAVAWLRGDQPFRLVVVQAPGFENRWASRAGEPEFVEGVCNAAGPQATACGVLGGDRIAYVTRDRGDSWEDQRLQMEGRLMTLLQPDGDVAVIALDPDPSSKFATEVVDNILHTCDNESSFDIGAEIEDLASGELSLKEAKSTLEKRYITAELFKSRGNITRAAESLGVHRPQLSNLIKKHNVNREDFE
ncbi:MAG: tetratricopeptide repeat protein [Planctomycetota bacterium]